MSDFHPAPVLVPTDLSAASANAVRVARSLAESDDQVTVVHVGLDHDLIAPAHIWGMEAIALDNLEEKQQRLASWVAENELGDVLQVVRCGDAGLEICQLAKELSCPLIIVPSHGHRGFKRVLLGSVAERVIRHAECSVLVLRRSDEGESADPSAWLPRQNVMIPVDLSGSSASAIETAHQFVDDPQRLNVVNVVCTLNESLMGSPAALTQDDLKDNRDQCLRRYLDERGWSSLNTQILFGDPGMTISEHADDTDCDLIVIPSHGFHGLDRLLLGSTTERVIRHTKCPVLVLRRHDAK